QRLPPFSVLSGLETALLLGPNGRQEIGKPPLRHLEDGQRLHQELRCRLGDLLELVGGSVGFEDLQEDAVMDAGEIQDAQLLSDRPAAELVGRPAAGFAAVGEVLEEGGSVVAPEPLMSVPGHVAPCRPVIASLGAAVPPAVAAAGTRALPRGRARCGRCRGTCPAAPWRRRPSAGCPRS